MPCCGLVNAPSLNVITKEGEDRLHKTLCQVCRAIIENWSSLGDHELKHEGISGGITNLLYRVRALRDVVPSSALVRVFGDKTEIIIDRKKETDILRQLSDMGFSVLLYGSFGNGRIEGWKDMRPLQPKEMGERQPRDICGAIASELAKMHELTPIELNNLERRPQVFVHIDRFQTNVETIDFNDSPERAKLYRRININKMAIETEWLRRVLPSDRNDYGAQIFAKLPEGPRVDAARFAMACVFAHNDLLSGNVLIDESNPPIIQFVDFEYACYNHRAHDIANHLTEYSGFDGDWGKNHPADEDILHFLEEYLKTSSEGSKLLAKYNNNERKVFIDELLAWVSRFCCLSRVYWGYWAIIQARYSPIDFDFLDYSRCSFVGHYYYKGLYSHLFFDH